MAMTPEKMVVFWGDQATGNDKGLEVATSSRNYPLATHNIAAGFKCCLMQGLVAWRSGIACPVSFFESAIGRIRTGLQILRTLAGEDDVNMDIPCESASILSFLVNDRPVIFDVDDLTADSLLDGVIANGLTDDWNQSKWNLGLAQLGKTKGSTLAVETYQTYRKLLQTEKSELANLVDGASKQFAKRKKNAFYSGGLASGGGGPMNDFVVDYVLAAILKKIDYKGDCIHWWKWD